MTSNASKIPCKAKNKAKCRWHTAMYTMESCLDKGDIAGYMRAKEATDRASRKAPEAKEFYASLPKAEPIKQAPVAVTATKQVASRAERSDLNSTGEAPAATSPKLSIAELEGIVSTLSRANRAARLNVPKAKTFYSKDKAVADFFS